MLGEKKTQVVLDVECYRNFFFVLLKDIATGKTKGWGTFNDENLDTYINGLNSILTHPEVEVITFNGNCYDLPMIIYAMSGATCADLKKASDEIITQQQRPHHFYRKRDLQEPAINHIDLIEVAPSMCSLKIYGGRMHTRRLQDLPIEPDETLDLQDSRDIMEYCNNDLEVTKELAIKLQPQIDLRRSMSVEYEVDLRSKSDAQVAEAVLKAEYTRLTGTSPPKSTIKYSSFKYITPSYIKFITQPLKELLVNLEEAEMEIGESGHVQIPNEIKNTKICIGETTYKIGIGGLHSQESEVSHYSTEETLVVDRDVVSYYPNLMLNGDLSPASFGEHFKPVYQSILDRRVSAKESGDMVTSNALKITLNGTFGKSSNKYSQLYSPKLMLSTTLTGQLSLLMVIEMLEEFGVPVVSANTDGIVMLIPVKKYAAVDRIFSMWEKSCSLKTEETRYASLHSRDVNNYIAVKTDGSTKGKGAYGEGGLMKNPQNSICAEVVSAYLATSGQTDIGDMIRECADIRKFLTVRTVAGGASKEGYILGKAIRWYYSTKCREGEVHYKKNGNTVPRTLGARLVLDLPPEIPNDLDYEWYIKECNEMLMSLGVIERPFVEKLPRKNSKEWKALKEAGKIKAGLRPKDKWEWV